MSQIAVHGRYMYPIQAPLHPMEHEALERYCQEHGLTRSQAMRKALNLLIGDAIRPSVRAVRRSGAYQDRGKMLDEYLTQGTPISVFAERYGISKGAVGMMLRQAKEERGMKIGFNEDTIKANQLICRRVVNDPFVPIGELPRRYMAVIAEVGQGKAPAVLGVSRQRVAQIVLHAKRLAGVTSNRRNSFALSKTESSHAQTATA